MSDDDLFGDALGAHLLFGGSKGHDHVRRRAEPETWEGSVNNKEEVIAGIEKGFINMLDGVPKKIRDDEDVILAAIRSWNYPDVLSHAGPNVRHLKSVVLEATNYGCEGAYENAREYLEKEKGVTITVPCDPKNFAPYAYPRQRFSACVMSSDYEFSKRLEETHKDIYFPFEHLHSTLKDDRAFVLKYADLPYSFVLDSLEWTRDDKDIVLIELKKGQKGAFNQVSDRLRNDPEVVITALRAGAKDVLPFIGADIQNNKEIFKIAAQMGCKDALRHASDALKKDETFVHEMVALAKESYLHADDTLKGSDALKKAAEIPLGTVAGDIEKSRLPGQDKQTQK